MKKLSALSITTIAFFLLGLISGVIQNTFYGYIDADGVIHDSLFLPLSAIFILIGVILLIVKLIIFIVRKLRK